MSANFPGPDASLIQDQERANDYITIRMIEPHQYDESNDIDFPSPDSKLQDFEGL